VYYYIVLPAAACYSKAGGHWLNFFLFLHSYKMFCLTDAEVAEKKKGNFSVILLGGEICRIYFFMAYGQG